MKMNFVVFRQKNDKKYRWNNVHFFNFEHSLALLVSRDCAIETPRWRYRANSAIILKAKFASKILWTFKVQKEKEEKMELIVHQPGKILQFLTEIDPKMTENDQNRQNNYKPYLKVSRLLNSLLRFGPKYGRWNPRFEVILGQSGHTIFFTTSLRKNCYV